MNHRIFSRVVYRAFTLAAAACALCCSQAAAQNGSGYETDPATGIVYRRVTRSIDRPVVETKVETQNQTVYRPEIVTETKPRSRTVYTPVVNYAWEPRLHGRWNPFRRPTVQYHHVGYTHWEPRNEVVQRTQSRTEWVPETRTIEVPTQVVRMQREQKVDLEAVGMVAPQQAAPASNVSSAIASRLRPLNSNERIQPMATSSGFVSRFSAPALADNSQIAGNTMGRLASDPPRRTIGQGGMRATSLAPTGLRIRGQALPPTTGGTGIANMQPLPFFR